MGEGQSSEEVGLKGMQPNSVAEWVTILFGELHDPQVLEVVLEPGVRAATVVCRGA